MPQPGKVVIVSEGADSHAAVIASGLSALGAPPILFSQSTMIGRGDVSIRYSNDPAGDIELLLGEDRFGLSEVSAFWNRRDPRHLVKPDNVHPGDKVQVVNSALAAMDGVRTLLDTRFAVNPTAAVKGCRKLNQLRAARLAGAVVPETLVTSCHRDWTDFFRRHGTVCAKPFELSEWSTSEGLVFGFSTQITSETAVEAESLALAPHIFQEWVKKESEVRLTAFGDFVVATRIRATPEIDSRDWRRSVTFINSLEPMTVPLAIADEVKRIMRLLGLRFGCFDYVIRPDGQWVFLEVNQAGAFIWQEEFCPDSVVVEPFLRYLIEARDDFTWSPSSRSAGLDAATLIQRSEREYGAFLTLPWVSREERGMTFSDTA